MPCKLHGIGVTVLELVLCLQQTLTWFCVEMCIEGLLRGRILELSSPGAVTRVS